ncbi:hypothetical protein [Arenimonas alkanexedens]
MFNTLHPDRPFLGAKELLEAASAIDAIHSRTIKAIERLERDVATRKAEISNRWKTASISSNDRRRIEAEEIRVATLTIRQNAERELDGLLKDAGATHAKATGQKPFYASPVLTLNRLTLGDLRRSAYQEQVAAIGPAEASHLGQWAVSTSNLPLAAALVTRVDAMPAASRPFNGVGLAEAMRLDEHNKAVEALKIIAARFQGVVIAIRAWKAAKANPMDTVSLSLLARTLDKKLLDSMEVADDAA